MNRVTSFFRLSDDNPFTGRHMLAIIGLFFGVVISVNMVMATFATGTFPGLVVKNSYVASQNYNERLAESREQERRGWSAAVTADDGRVRVEFTDSGGVPIIGLRIEARAGRPASAREDRTLVLEPDADAYVAAETLPPGRWLLELEAWSGETPAYRAKHPLYVRGDAS